MATGTDLIEVDGEALEISSALQLTEPMGVSLARAEIDVQIATARRYPRSITRVAKNIRDLVTLDKETAAECMYALPRGGKPIQGPSIRLAEIVFQCWGNARCDARVVGVDRMEKVIIAEGIYHDLETNSAGRATVRRRISKANGKLFDDDMIAVTGNAACSIAKRNAILAGVPKTVWNRAYLDAREVVAGTIATLAVSRDKAIAAFANFGVKPEQIFPAIGIAGLEEITLDHIPVLRGMFSAIKNGEATVEEMFAPPKAAGHAKVVDPLADEVPKTEEPKDVGPPEGQAEDERRDAIGDDKPAADTDPSVSVYQDMHALISDGATYLAARNKLDPEALALLSKDQVEKLKKLAGGAK